MFLEHENIASQMPEEIGVDGRPRTITFIYLIQSGR